MAEILIQSTIALAHISFVCLLALHRLGRCVRPNRAALVTQTVGSVLVVGVYLVSISVVMLTLGRSSNKAGQGICRGFMGMSENNMLHHNMNHNVSGNAMTNISNHDMSGMSGMQNMQDMREMASSEGTIRLMHSGMQMAKTSDPKNSTVDVMAVPAESIQLLLAILVPFIGTICANTAIWIVTCSRSQKFNYRPIITVSVISVQVILSWVPMMVILIFKHFEGNQDKQSHLDHLSLNLHLLGIITNPIVYTMFSQGFQSFLKQKMYDIMTCYVCQPSTDECVAPEAAVVVRRQSSAHACGMVSTSPSIRVSLRSTTMTYSGEGGQGNQPNKPHYLDSSEGTQGNHAHRPLFLGAPIGVGASGRRNSIC